MSISARLLEEDASSGWLGFWPRALRCVREGDATAAVDCKGGQANTHAHEKQAGLESTETL